MVETQGYMLHEKILKIWCVLVYILIRLYLEKLIYFYIKNNYYSYYNVDGLQGIFPMNKHEI